VLNHQRGLYIISVAARLLEMHPQTLRKYERAGFLTPDRTGGMLRLYSEEDIARLQLIKHLVDDLGLNLSGVQLALQLATVLREVERVAGGGLQTEQERDHLRKVINAGLHVLGLAPREPRGPQEPGPQTEAPAGASGV
jgi:MerR family transcriptional regulator/heat shock protein HspR